MGKNIILCADGTGNRGGYTPDSNVYKIYKSIDLNHPEKKQIAFYDNGVGTQKNKFFRGLSAAFGFGFKSNVCDLYEYLARHYYPGDNIYMFGFSRGAATIRAFNGFIDACGLIDGRDKGNKELKADVKLAMKAYEKAKESRSKILSEVKIHDVCPKIQLIGVWDTVSALGFPENTDIAGIFMRILNAAFMQLGTLSDKFFPHKYYNYELTPNVINAYQALAIDDERTSFWPKVWDKDSHTIVMGEVDQVWFAGMHSNVGGGYQRAGLANVSFDWMLRKIEGIKFKGGVLQSARDDANENGRLYDSRQGFASYYRYHPRDIAFLCKEAGGVPVKIHESVMRRLKLRTANYAPTLLPREFNVACNDGNDQPSPKVHEDDWNRFRKEIDDWIGVRKWLYGILLELTLIVLGIAIYLWNYPDPPQLDGINKHIFDIASYFTPEMFDELIAYVITNPGYWYGLLGLFVFCIYLWLRKIARYRTTLNAERMRKLYIIAPEGHPDFSGKLS